MTAILVLICLVAIALVIPPRYDPAIRLKEYNESKKYIKEG